MRDDDTPKGTEDELVEPRGGLLLGGTSYSRVRDVIRRDILTGDFKAGERLKAPELAERYGVSPVPVREALQQLQGEGLVVIEPNRGASVREVNDEFIRNIFEIREVLGAYLIRKAVRNTTPELVEELARLNDGFEQALDGGDVPAMLSWNGRFHDAHIRAGRNPEAERVLASQAALARVLRRRVGFSPARIDAMRREHRAIVEAFQRRDADRAARILALHTRGSLRDMLKRVAA
jgi:DNA-binding GntR family transcriptional regulator